MAIELGRGLENRPAGVLQIYPRLSGPVLPVAAAGAAGGDAGGLESGSLSSSNPRVVALVWTQWASSTRSTTPTGSGSEADEVYRRRRERLLGMLLKGSGRIPGRGAPGGMVVLGPVCVRLPGAGRPREGWPSRPHGALFILATNKIYLGHGGPLHRKRSPSPSGEAFQKEQGKRLP